VSEVQPPVQPVTAAPACSRCALLEVQIAELRAQIAELTRRLNEDSTNSHRPPSSDPPWKPKPAEEKPTGRKPGGQPGHPGKTRKFYAPDQVSKVVDHKPASCGGCGHALLGDDPAPSRRQIADIPEIRPYVEEHRCHTLTCLSCGTRTRAELPADLPAGAFGGGAKALIAYFTGQCRLGKRQVAALMSDLFNLDMSVGAVSAHEQEMSGELAPAVDKAHAFARSQAAVGADETSWTEARQSAWLWTLATSQVVVFLVRRGRGGDVARELLGEGFQGVVTTDRWSAYKWLDLRQRQLCWAHLIRDFKKLRECPEPFATIGQMLLDQSKRLFDLWKRVRDGTLKLSSFGTYVSPIRQKIRSLLEGAGAVVSTHGKAAALCRGILDLEAAMWTFASVPGVEPTNNASERSLRHAVVWRNSSLGTHSPEGSRFVERILTTVASLRRQGRNVLAFLKDTLRAARTGEQKPSLLPLG